MKKLCLALLMAVAAPVTAQDTKTQACVLQAEMMMRVATLRDMGMPLSELLNGYEEVTKDPASTAAFNLLIATVYDSPGLSPASVYVIVYKGCMK